LTLPLGFLNRFIVCFNTFSSLKTSAGCKKTDKGRYCLYLFPQRIIGINRGPEAVFHFRGRSGNRNAAIFARGGFRTDWIYYSGKGEFRGSKEEMFENSGF
jgi:hypothetical protein